METIEYKKCIRCNQILPVENFNWKLKYTKRQGYCRVCSNKASRVHYNENKQSYLDKAKKHRAKEDHPVKLIRRYICEYLSVHPCVDCGETDIVVLEFDHVNGKKIFNVSEALRISPKIEDLKEEISKCEIRCANCHIKRHAKDRNLYKYKYKIEHK